MWWLSRKKCNLLNPSGYQQYSLSHFEKNSVSNEHNHLNGRARYKNVDVPTYVELIDSTRLNLRRRITDIFHRGVEAATLSELSVASAVHVPSEATLKSEELTAADTLLLRQQGILPDTTVQKADSLLMPAAGEPLDGGSRETVVPDRKGKSSRRKQRKQSSEAVLPEERTATR